MSTVNLHIFYEVIDSITQARIARVAKLPQDNYAAIRLRVDNRSGKNISSLRITLGTEHNLMRSREETEALAAHLFRQHGHEPSVVNVGQIVNGGYSTVTQFVRSQYNSDKTCFDWSCYCAHGQYASGENFGLPDVSSG